MTNKYITFLSILIKSYLLNRKNTTQKWKIEIENFNNPFPFSPRHGVILTRTD